MCCKSCQDHAASSRGSAKCDLNGYDDFNVNCPMYAENGSCTDPDFKDWMHATCCKSCDQYTAAAAVQVGSALEVIPLQPDWTNVDKVKGSECVNGVDDFNVNCGRYADQKLCTNPDWHDWMMAMCCKSCQDHAASSRGSAKCDLNGYDDFNVNCPTYAENGSCTDPDFKDWMHATCCKSCDKYTAAAGVQVGSAGGKCKSKYWSVNGELEALCAKLETPFACNNHLHRKPS